jgi:hypothetical protein
MPWVVPVAVAAGQTSEGAEESGSRVEKQLGSVQNLFIDDYTGLFYPTHAHTHIITICIYIYIFTHLPLSLYIYYIYICRRIYIYTVYTNCGLSATIGHPFSTNQCLFDDDKKGVCSYSGESWPQTSRVYPLVNIQKAIENGHRNSGFTH